MPLRKGYSVESFDENVRELFHANKTRKKKRSRKQILAIAYAQARKAAERAGRKPSWLRRRKTKHRRSR